MFAGLTFHEFCASKSYTRESNSSLYLQFIIRQRRKGMMKLVMELKKNLLRLSYR